jgi:hypothetical protein
VEARSENQSAATEKRRHNMRSFYAPSVEISPAAAISTEAGELSLDEEIACARVALRRVLDALVRSEQHAELDNHERANLLALTLQAVRTVARLLRAKRAMSECTADGDGTPPAIAAALDALSEKWGIDL